MRAPVVDEHGEVWIDSATAALVLGYSPQYLGRLAIAERIPGRRESNTFTSRWWFRRRDVEQLAAARAFRRRRQMTPSAHGQPTTSPRV